MPTLKISEEEKARRETIATIEYYMQMQKVNKEQLAKKSCIAYSTLCKKMNHPDGFTCGELRRICRTLHIEKTERGKLI